MPNPDIKSEKLDKSISFRSYIAIGLGAIIGIGWVIYAGYWLRDDNGALTKAMRHICWDGCMFPNEVMMDPQTWNDILGAMVAVQDAHGWNE